MSINFMSDLVQDLLTFLICQRAFVIGKGAIGGGRNREPLTEVTAQRLFFPRCASRSIRHAGSYCSKIPMMAFEHELGHFKSSFERESLRPKFKSNLIVDICRDRRCTSQIMGTKAEFKIFKMSEIFGFRLF